MKCYAFFALIGVGILNSFADMHTIDFRGNGASISSQQEILQGITSTGPLGDVFLFHPTGIVANVSAPSIVGNITALGGPIAGTIQTTGQQIDPIFGFMSSVSADFGRTLTDASGKIQGVTTVQATGGLSGRLISRGNLVSQITLGGGLSGVVAAQGDIGALQRNPNGTAVVDGNGHLSRFGGLYVSGAIHALPMPTPSTPCSSRANSIWATIWTLAVCPRCCRNWLPCTSAAATWCRDPLSHSRTRYSVSSRSRALRRDDNNPHAFR